MVYADIDPMIFNPEVSKEFNKKIKKNDKK